MSITYFGTFCVFIFVWRYWDRGEDDVNVRAFEKFMELSETPSNQPVRPTPDGAADGQR